MAEIDPVILELRAEMGRYRAELKSSTSLVSQQLGRQERSVQRLEAQMRKSSGAIGNSLRGIATTLGTYFTGRELTGMIDSFTRLQNSLRVAGLEGQNLERVQRDLLDLSTRYGVGIEGLANLYGKATDAGRSFGASQEQVLQLTEATSQALLITGTSAAQAQGAILGLSQALASGTVRAEEYNQINEGGLRPLLQAAAASERFGGDINKLRAAMLDGKVSSQEFFNSILAGSQQLEGQASKATLTLSGAFEALTSRLTVYIGQNAEASGVTAALAGAMQLLAENLDTIIPALAVIATALGGRLLAGALAGGTALRTLAAYASIATTSLAGTALAARSAGAALLAAFGGPVGLAITAVALGLAYVVTESNRADEATGQYKKSLDESKVASDKAREAAERLANAHGKTRAEALKAAQAERESTKQKLAGAKASLILAQAELKKATAFRAAQNVAASGSTGLPGTGLYIQGVGDKRVAQARANVSAEEQAIKNFENAITGLTNMIEGSAPPSVAAVDDKKKKTKKGPKDRTDELAARAAQDLYQIQIEELRAKAQLATDATQRASLEREILAKERDAREADISAAVKSGDLTKKQADAQREILAKLYGKRDAENKEGDILVQAQKSLYAMQIAREERLQLFEEEKELAQTQFNAQSDALRQQYDLAKSQAERRRLAFEIIDLEYEYRDAQLEATKNNKDLSKAVRDRASLEQAYLREAQGRTVEQARRDTAGPLENYFDRARMDAEELNEAYQQIAVDGLGSVTDALADTATGFLKLGGTAGKVIDGIISDLIRLAIQQQIVGLFGSLFGGGPNLANTSGGPKAFGKTFGRASGGYVAPGQTVRVNEHLGGAEYLRMGSQGGTVIPLGQVNQTAAQPVTARQGPIELRVYADRGAFISDVQAISQGEAVKVTLEAAPAIIDRAANETIRRSNRPRMPGAGR